MSREKTAALRAHKHSGQRRFYTAAFFHFRNGRARMHKVSEDFCGQNCGERPGAEFFAGHESLEMQAYLLFVEMEHFLSTWVQSLL